MKVFKTLILFLFSMAGFFNAQGQDIDFNVRYNGVANVYEVYARPTFTDPFYFVGGGSQVTVLLPSSIGDTPIAVTPINGGLWSDNSQLYAPSADPAHDFHGIATNGAPVAFVAGVELLLYTFVLPDGCVSEIRLFENGSDPASSDPGMNGGDFEMFFANVFDPFTNDWNSNYVNGGLVCPNAPLVLPNPITISQGSTANQCMPILDLNPLDAFTATLCNGSPANGTTTLNVTDYTLCLEYTPSGNFTGQDDICIIVCDMANLCDTVSVPVTVLPALENCTDQTPPIVIATPITVAQDSTTTVCTNILDHNVGDSFTALLCGGTPLNGSVTTTVIADVLCIEYTPNTGFTGTDDLCIQVCDPLNNCDFVNIPVSVIATPVAADVAQNPVLVMPPLVTQEDITHTICGPIIDANITDAHTVTICGQGNNGTATATVDNAGHELCLTYDPNPNFAGRDSVCVEICDQASLCYSLMVPVEVTTANDAPIAVNDVNLTQIETAVSGVVLTNDFDVEGHNLTISTTPLNVMNGTAVIDAAGNYTFTPNNGFVGDASFEYEICDDGCPSRCAIALVVISVFDNVDPNNNNIVAIPDNYGMFSDNVLISNLVANDYDPDGDNIIINTTPITNPTNGLVVINPDGTFTYTPNAGYFGTDTFEYLICDDGSPVACDQALVTINIFESTNTNSTFAVDDATAGEINNLQAGNVLTNDYDPEGDNILVNTTPVVNVTNGTLTLNANGTYTYQPNIGFIGNDFFVYEICDDGSPVACDMATVYIAVLDSKDTPIVITNPITVDMDDVVSICAPIIDPNAGDTFVLTPCAGSPANGSVNVGLVNGNVCVDYTPNIGYVGTDEYCVIVCDQTNRCDTAIFPITVVPPVQPATLADAPDAIITPITVAQDSSAYVCSTILDGNAGETFTASLCNGTPANGAVNISFSGNEYCIEYTPNTGYAGTDHLCLIICDAGGDCDNIIVPVSVVPTPQVDAIPQNPILVMPPVVTYEDVNGNACGTIIDANVSDTHTVSICGAAANGVATATVDNATNSLCVDYDPNSNFIGSDEVCVEVCDQSGLCYNMLVPIEVIPVNDPPIAIDDINNTQVNIPVGGNVLTNDSDPEGDNLTVTTTVLNPMNGTVTMDPFGVYTFTPAPGFIGTGSFEYEVCDDGNPIECDTALVTIEVIDVTNPNNNGVLGVPDHFTTEDDSPLTADVLANDSDPDGDNLTINTTPVTIPANGTLVINPDGTFNYVPVLGVYGVQTFSYQVCDDGTPQVCDIVPVTITVLEGDNTNSLFATDDFYIGDEDETITGNLVLNDNDPENGVLSVNTTPVVAPTNGTLTLNPNGTFTYVPNPDFTGNDQFVYTVCDDGTPTACDEATVYITILNVSTELRLKVMLQGALYGTTDNLMRSDLVTQNLVPLAQPYDPATEPAFAQRFNHVIGGNEVTTDAVLNANAGTSDAIVDWVFVELRDETDSITVIRTLSALVQRDGDVVNAADGGVIYVDSLPTNFFVVVKHRNHLGAMTASPVVSVAKVSAFDFSAANAARLYHTATGYDGAEQVTYGGHQALWAGNSNADGKVKYDGTTNDRIIVNANVILDPGNTSNTLNFNNAIDYYLGDVNLDGKAKYDGINNDRILLQSGVLTYPLNTAFLNNYDLMIEQVK